MNLLVSILNLAIGVLTGVFILLVYTLGEIGELAMWQSLGLCLFVLATSFRGILSLTQIACIKSRITMMCSDTKKLADEALNALSQGNYRRAKNKLLDIYNYRLEEEEE